MRRSWSGLGIALLADWLVGPDVRKRALVRVLESVEASPAPIQILTPPGRYTTGVTRALVDHLAAALTPLLMVAAGHSPRRRP